MKRITIITASILLIVSMFAAVTASAALIGGDGGFYYNLHDNKTATLAEYHGTSEDVNIPGEVYSYTVTEIAENTFSNNTKIRSVRVPETVTAIGAYAFFGCKSLETAVIPSSVEKIGAATFYNCESLTMAAVPPSVTSIAANAFTGCPDGLTIIGIKGSYAEEYAHEHGYNFEGSAIYGDADFDGVVSSTDALFVLRVSVGLAECTPDLVPVLDIDGDGMLLSTDALELLRYSVDLPANERIGKLAF